MLTINVKTKAVSGWNRRNPMARNEFGDATPGYVRGHMPPNFPVPAIQYKVCFYASGDCIEIRSFKGVGSKRSYIDRVFWKPV